VSDRSPPRKPAWPGRASSTIRFWSITTQKLARRATAIARSGRLCVVLVERKCCGRPAVSKGADPAGRGTFPAHYQSAPALCPAGCYDRRIELSCIWPLRRTPRPRARGQTRRSLAQQVFTGRPNFIYQLHQRGEPTWFTGDTQKQCCPWPVTSEGHGGTEPTPGSSLRLPKGYTVAGTPLAVRHGRLVWL